MATAEQDGWGDGEDDAVPVVTRAVQEMGLDATAGSNTVTDGDSVDGADEKPAPGGRSRKGNRGVPMQVPIGHRSATVNGSTVTLCVEDVHAMFDPVLVDALDHPRDRQTVLRMEEDIVAFMEAEEAYVQRVAPACGCVLG